MSTPWLLSKFNEACDVLETILSEIKREDSSGKDCKSEPFEFEKYAELESLCMYMKTGSDKAQTKRLFSELRHTVKNFLHYQKLRCFWLREWNHTFHESREFCRYIRFIPLEAEFSEILSTKSHYVVEETERYVNCAYADYKHAQVEEYITKEDEYLERVKELLASEFGEKIDAHLVADFVDIEKALKCRRLYILCWWSNDSDFKRRLHELWPFMNQHKLWSLLTPSQYKECPEQYRVHR